MRVNSLALWTPICRLLRSGSQKLLLLKLSGRGIIIWNSGSLHPKARHLLFHALQLLFIIILRQLVRIQILRLYFLHLETPVFDVR